MIWLTATVVVTTAGSRPLGETMWASWQAPQLTSGLVGEDALGGIFFAN